MHDGTIISYVKHFGQIHSSSSAIKGFLKLGRPLVQTFPPFAIKPKPNNHVWAWPWLSGHMGVRRCVLMELWAQGEYVWACWHACATWCCGVHGVQLPTAYMHRFGQMKSPLFIQCLQSVSNSNKQENNRINDANFFKQQRQ